MKLTSKLFDYQESAFDKLRRVKVGALYMEMGTGKTRTALELIHRRLSAGKVEQVLWLCPYSCVKDLPELLSEHAEEFCDIIRIAGIESLSSSVKLYAELMQYVRSRPTYLIVDESLLTKNPFAYRTRRIIEISSKCKYKLILNGTPISRNETDLFAQWYILDWRILGYRSYYSFAANHIEYSKTVPGKIEKALNVEYLSEKIAPYTYECRKSDVLSLPPKIPYDAPFHLTCEQQDHYDAIAEVLLAQVDDFRPETIYRLFYALQSITSGFAINIDKFGHMSRKCMVSPNENPRIEALEDTFYRIGNQQSVIYCRYTQEINDILSVVGDRAVPFYGDMTRNARQNNKTKFKNGDAQYLVANKSCAQFGLNLQFCSNVIFYNNDWDWATRAQAEDRVHRSGQLYDVNIHDIYASNTIDITIYRCLMRKESLSDRFKDTLYKNNMRYMDMLINAVKGLDDQHE